MNHTPPPPTRRVSVTPRAIALTAIVYLAFAWSVVYLVDVFDVFGARSWFHSIGSQGVWYTVFQETGPTEWLQWLALSLSAVVAAYIVGTYRQSSPLPQVAMFWMVMSAAFMLMLIEDAGDPRHKVVQYVVAAFDSRTVGHVVEFFYFLALAAVPLFALVRYGRSVWSYRTARLYLLGGFVFYAIGGGNSALRYLGSWYERAGAWVDQYIMLGRLPRADLYHSHEFWLMDTIIEESFELLGAAAFLAATVAFACGRRDAQPSPVPPASPVTDVQLRPGLIR